MLCAIISCSWWGDYHEYCHLISPINLTKEMMSLLVFFTFHFQLCFFRKYARVLLFPLHDHLGPGLLCSPLSRTRDIRCFYCSNHFTKNWNIWSNAFLGLFFFSYQMSLWIILYIISTKRKAFQTNTCNLLHQDVPHVY